MRRCALVTAAGAAADDELDRREPALRAMLETLGHTGDHVLHDYHLGCSMLKQIDDLRGEAFDWSDPVRLMARMTALKEEVRPTIASPARWRAVEAVAVALVDRGRVEEEEVECLISAAIDGATLPADA